MKFRAQRIEENRDLESRRLDALRRYGVLDTPSEDVFSSIVAATAAACDVAICSISLVDSSRLWFLSEVGLGCSEVLRDNSFCTFAIAEPDVFFEVPDASRDARFKDSSFVTCERGIRFYAAQPLRTPDGYALGTLCVLGYQPGKLSESERSTLKHMAQLVMSLLEDRISSPVSVIGRAVEDTLHNGIIIVDPHRPGYPITFCNRGFRALTGYSDNEIIGRNCCFLKGEKTDRQRVEDIQDAIKNKKVFSTILRNYKKDGTEFWNELTISPITDGAGNLNYYIGLMSDVSALMQALDRLEASNENLQNSVELHATDRDALALSNEALKREISQRKKIEQQSLEFQAELVHIDRLSTMGEMATGLAHELNQPLFAISQCADTAMLVARENNISNLNLTECLADIQDQAQRAGEIIRALRQFVNRDTSNRSAVNINELVSQAIRLTKSDSRALNIDITLVDGEIPELNVDRVQVAQVVVNLLRNSVDAISSINSQDSSAVVHAIRVRTELVDDTIVICFSDTGPGFNPDIEPFKIFESSKKDGLGIGLSISRSIIESHDGRLWMDESYIEGCCMCVSIPVQ